MRRGVCVEGAVVAEGWWALRREHRMRKRRPGEAEQGGVCESGREVEAERERRRSRGGGIRISVTLPVLARAEGEDG